MNFCDRKFDKRKILFRSGFINARGMRLLFCGVGWLPSFRISPSLNLRHEVTYSFSVDFALVPAFHLAILVFPICHGIDLFQILNLHKSPY